MPRSQQKKSALIALLALSSFLQGCQSQSSFGVTDENAAVKDSSTLKAKQHDAQTMGSALPLPILGDTHVLGDTHDAVASRPVMQPLSPSNSSPSNSSPSNSVPFPYELSMASTDKKMHFQHLDKTDAVHNQDSKRLSVKPFGKREWKQYFGVDVGNAPLLPRKIHKIMKAPCPRGFRLEGEPRARKVEDNHLLVLIPATVNGEPFTLDKLGELVTKQFPHNEDGYAYYNADIQEAFGNQPLPEAPYWLLMTYAALENSLHETYNNQQAIVNRYSSYGYRLPYGLEAATCILANYARSGKRQERLFGADPYRYTCCTATQLVHSNGPRPILVGGFGDGGLCISFIGCYGGGVACCRKL